MSTSLFVQVVEDAAPERRALVAQSPSMQQLVQRLPRIAASGGAVLLRGERGTGKERIARELHRLGPAASGPFVVVAPARSPSEAVPSAAARGGTLYVDEVGELGLAAQAELLRALDDGVRVVAATRHDLAAEIEAKRFRTDLGQRLQAIVVDVPPLRARREDVEPLFAACFAAAAPSGRAANPPVPLLTGRALTVLTEYGWPGNVRELECLARLLAFAVTGAHEPIDSTDLPPRYFATRAAPNARSGVPPLADVERRHILAVYEHAGRNKRRASDLLGISLRTLYNKLTEYHVHGAGASAPAAGEPDHGVGSAAGNGVRNGGVVR
jgi:DNA-binding NtrC family response regulator